MLELKLLQNMGIEQVIKKKNIMVSKEEIIKELQEKNIIECKTLKELD